MIGTRYESITIEFGSSRFYFYFMFDKVSRRKVCYQFTISYVVESRLGTWFGQYKL